MGIWLEQASVYADFMSAFLPQYVHDQDEPELLCLMLGVLL